MSTTEIFLIAMAIIFTVPYLVWRLSDIDYYAPLVVVQIIAGILLGPGVLGKFFPDYYTFVFSAPVVQSLNGIGWWAVMVFVCIAGIELDLHEAWKHRRESGITAGLALGVPLVFGCAAGIGMLAYPGWIGAKAQDWQFVVGVGMACAVTALPILILLMEKLEVLRQPIGQRILRYASLDDIAIWGVLAVIMLDWTRVGKQTRLLARLRARGVRVPPADASHSGSATAGIVDADLARAVRLRRRLVRPALHGRRVPRRRDHGRALVRPEAAGLACATTCCWS